MSNKVMKDNLSKWMDRDDDEHDDDDHDSVVRNSNSGIKERERNSNRRVQKDLDYADISDFSDSDWGETEVSSGGGARGGGGAARGNAGNATLGRRKSTIKVVRRKSV